MITIIYYTTKGEIVSKFGVPEFAVDSYIPEEGLTKTIIANDIDVSLYYIKNNGLTLLPAKPDINYKFNYDTEVWEIDPIITGNLIRDTRNSLLEEADILIFKAEDLGQPTTVLRQYRQALRDVTKQEGFPLNVTFPEIP